MSTDVEVPEGAELRPLGDRVLIAPDAGQKVTESGIVLPEQAVKETNRGLVLAVGPGRPNDMTGRPTPIPVEPGDRVLYSKYAGTKIEQGGLEYVLVRYDDVIAAWDGAGETPSAES